MVTYSILDFEKYKPENTTCPSGVNQGYAEGLSLNKETEEKTYQYMDKIVKKVLSSEKEFIKFIAKYLENEQFGKLKETDIEKCNKEFVTLGFKKRESDIIYRIKDRDTYVILEHQSTIDYVMAKRMCEYCIELLNQVTKSTKKVPYPTICPIVLYTGDRIWDADLTIKQKPSMFPALEYPTYNLIDINNYTKEELIDENSAISKVLLFQKVKNKEQLVDVLKKLTEKELTKEEKECIKLIFKFSNGIRRMISKEKLENFINEIEKGGDEMRFDYLFVELIKDKMKEGLEEGRQEGLKQGRQEGMQYNIPINVDTVEEGYPILCA